ncbi:MAG TPA: hypothetical protein VFW83_09490 [Bryobacteraceae bacterium]|nr:hypothetical protein [Bryobacteraceae bacterium]
MHAVITSEVRLEKILNDFKSYASRWLNRLGQDGFNRKYWARHGSTRWLRTEESVEKAVKSVIERQGEAMALFIAPVTTRSEGVND